MLRIKETNLEAFFLIDKVSLLQTKKCFTDQVSRYIKVAYQLVAVRFEGVYAKPVPVSLGYDHVANKTDERCSVQ